MTPKRPLQPNDLYRLRLVSDPQIAPDGSRIAFVLKQMNEEKNEYLSNIHVVDREGHVSQFTSGDKDSAPRWSPDGKWLAFLSGRKEGAQIHLLPTDGGESTALTERKLGAGVPLWAPDSTAIAFAAAVSTDAEEEDAPKDNSGARDEGKVARTKVTTRASYKSDGSGYVADKRSHIFRIDLADRKVAQITQGDFGNGSIAWSPDSQHLAFVSNRSERWDVDAGSDLYVMPRDGGAARKLAGGTYHAPVFSPDGSRIAFLGHQDGNIFAPADLYTVNRDGSDFRREAPEWDAEFGTSITGDVVQGDDGLCFRWHPDGLYFLGGAGPLANIYRLRDGAIEPVTEGRHVLTDFSLADDGTIAYSAGDPTHLAEVYLRTPEGVRQLTHENDAFLDEVRIFTPEHFRYPGAGGEDGDGWLLAPQGSEWGKHPLIVYVHGGPQMAYGEALFFEFQYLVGQGFGVYYSNIHGSAHYGRDYQKSIWGRWGTIDFEDVLAGTHEAAKREWVDPNRIGIIGGSYGGYMTNWAMSHSDLYKAGVTERCVSNLVSFVGTSDGGWLWDRVFDAFPEDDVQKLWDMSPIKYVKDVQHPLMVIHYEGDDRTPLEQGEQMFLALRRLGKTTKFIIFPEESHGMTRGGKPSRRVERMSYIAEWFREHL